MCRRRAPGGAPAAVPVEGARAPVPPVPAACPFAWFCCLIRSSACALCCLNCSSWSWTAPFTRLVITPASSGRPDMSRNASERPSSSSTEAMPVGSGAAAAASTPIFAGGRPVGVTPVSRARLPATRSAMPGAAPGQGDCDQSQWRVSSITSQALQLDSSAFAKAPRVGRLMIRSTGGATSGTIAWVIRFRRRQHDIVADHVHDPVFDEFDQIVPRRRRGRS